MSGIKYNEEQEAYELEYTLWGGQVRVLFYVDSENEIMDGLTEIADKLERINRNKNKIAAVIMREGWYEKGRFPMLDEKRFSDSLSIADAFVDMEDDDGMNAAVIRFIVTSSEGYLKGRLAVEIETDNGMEIVGWD